MIADSTGIPGVAVLSPAGKAALKAERDRVFAGPRAEEVATLGRSVETAEANLLLAQQEDAR